MADRAGQLRAGRYLFWTVLPPLFVLPPFRGRNGGRFKTYKREIVMKASTHVLKHSHTSHTRVKNRPIKSHSSVIEHTPIYDLKAFEKRQKQRKLNQLVKTTLSHCFVFVTFTLAFSLLFIGE